MPAQMVRHERVNGGAAGVDSPRLRCARRPSLLRKEGVKHRYIQIYGKGFDKVLTVFCQYFYS